MRRGIIKAAGSFLRSGRLLRAVAPWAVPGGCIALGALIVALGRHRAAFTLVGSAVAFAGVLLPLAAPKLCRKVSERLKEDADILEYLAGRDQYPMMLDDVPLASQKEDEE